MHPSYQNAPAWRRKLAFAGNLARRNVKRGTRPYKAIMVVTWGCQARCVMCDIWKRQPLDELTLDEYVKFFAANPYFTWLTLTGGEPFDREDLVEIARAAYRTCPGLYCLNSNTNSLNPDSILEKTEGILNTGVPRYILAVSLDGPPEVHNRVRGLPGTFDKAMRVLKGAKELQKHYRRLMVVVEHTVLPPAFGLFSAMVDAVRELVPGLTAADFVVTTPNVSSHYYGNTAAAAAIRTSISADAVQQALHHILATREKAFSLSPLYMLPQMYLRMALPYVRTYAPPMRCQATRSTVFIDPNGIVYPCNAYTRVLGHLREADYSLEKILARDDMAQIRKDIDEFKCGGCWTPCEASQSLGEGLLRPAVIGRAVQALVSRTRVARTHFDVPEASPKAVKG